MLPVDHNPTPVFEEETSVDLRQYLVLILRWWWIIIIAMLVSGGTGFVFSSRMTPVYQATTTLLINEAPSTRNTDYNSILTSQQLAQTYAQMITKLPVMEEVVKRLQVPMEPKEVLRTVSVTPIRDTQLLTLNVQSTNPHLAAAIANTVAEVFSDRIRESQTLRFGASKESLATQLGELDKQINQTRADLVDAQSGSPQDLAEIDRLEARLNRYEQIYSNLTLSYEQVRLAEAQSISSVSQVEDAAVPETPISPKTMQNTILAVVVGLMLSVGGIFVYDMLDDTIKNPEEITRRYRLPVLGVIASYKEPQDELITCNHPRSPITESFRALRTNVQYASVDHPMRTILVTSPTPSDGKTTVAANLAVVMAQSGWRVTLMDADLHRPRQHKLFKTDRMPGLSSLFVRGNVILNGAFRPTLQNSLNIITAGELPPNPAELLGSNKMREIINEVSEKSDVVLIDTPPVLSLNDSVALSPLVDGVLIVVKPGVTKMGSLKAVVDHLRHVGANMIGVVLNDVNQKKSSYGYYYKSYYSQYKYYETGEAKKNTRKQN